MEQTFEGQVHHYGVGLRAGSALLLTDTSDVIELFRVGSATLVSTTQTLRAALDELTRELRARDVVRNVNDGGLQVIGEVLRTIDRELPRLQTLVARWPHPAEEGRHG